MCDAETRSADSTGANHARVSRFVALAHSLQFKSTLLVVGLTLGVAAAVSSYLLRASANMVHDAQRTEIVQLASMLARNAAHPIEYRDAEGLRQLAQKVTSDGPLEYIVFTGVDGAELASAERHPGAINEEHLPSGNGGPRLTGAPSYLASAEAHAPYLDITYPISTRTSQISKGDDKKAELVGYLRAGILADVWHRSMSSTLDLLVGVGAIAVVVAIPLGFLLVRRIVSPLEALASAMLRFSEGDLSVRSPVHRRDELGKLADTFNRMADQHERAHERAVRLNVELERRVAQRTRQLRELAARDPLTGLFNRRRFGEALHHALAEAQRYNNELSCVMADLDAFKRVNDRFGHQVGDEILISTASTISSQLRTTDVAARFGGDEFVVLLTQTGASDAYVLGQRIAEKFASDVAERYPQIEVGISIGIASLRSADVSDAESLLRAADRAMYRAKAAGTNLVCLESDSQTPAVA